MLRYFLLLSLVFTVACASARKESDQLPCLPKNYKSFTISWGEYSPKNGTFIGYKIDVYGDLYLFNRKHDEEKSELIIALDKKESCEILNLANETILKTQALYAPSERSHFIQYSVPNDNVFMLAVWNPTFSTKGSKEYRFLFDELMKLVPSARILSN